MLWLLLSLFFASGVFYVRMRIRLMMAQRRGVAGASNRARWSCLVFHAFLLVLGPLILLHELGHFLVAKRAGIRALEFGMGYPPRARKAVKAARSAAVKL